MKRDFWLDAHQRRAQVALPNPNAPVDLASEGKMAAMNAIMDDVEARQGEFLTGLVLGGEYFTETVLAIQKLLGVR